MTTTYPVETLGHNDDDGTIVENVNTLAENVVGHRIVKAEKTTREAGASWHRYAQEVFVITLDNGKEVVLADTTDCCAYTALDSFLLNADKVDHIITGVGTTDSFQTWHIYADFGDVLQLDVSWSCGNPFYYGYGFTIEVVDVGGDGEQA